MAGWSSGYPRQRSAMMLLTMPGRMAPKPPERSKRASIQRSARLIAALRARAMGNRSAIFRALSVSRKTVLHENTFGGRGRDKSAFSRPPTISSSTPHSGGIAQTGFKA